jgi:hypothetical protein
MTKEHTASIGAGLLGIAHVRNRLACLDQLPGRMCIFSPRSLRCIGQLCCHTNLPHQSMKFQHKAARLQRQALETCNEEH